MTRSTARRFAGLLLPPVAWGAAVLLVQADSPGAPALEPTAEMEAREPRQVDQTVETLRLRGQITAEGGGPIPGARIRTDALRGPLGAQFAGQRTFTVRTNQSGDWSLLGVTRGLWFLEVSAADHLPHVVVVPIYMMLRPEPVPWDTSISLLPASLVVAAGTAEGGDAGRRVVEAADRALAGDRTGARDALLRLREARLDAPALCAAGDAALIAREPAMARQFFELAATADGKWYRPHVGIASASMMLFDFDRAIKAYAAARAGTGSKRLERMLSGAIRELQQIRTIGGG